MITKQAFGIGLLVVALMAGTGAFGDVYLSTAGNDGNSGLNAGAPKLTLSAALGVFNTQGAPTTLHIAAGTYTENGVFNVTPVGTAVNAVIIQGEGGTVNLVQSVLNVQGAYTQIKDISFNEARLHEACIVIRSSAGNCTVQLCTFTGALEQPAEHFNTGTTDFTEPEDVAPIQIMAAPSVTIATCTFAPQAASNLWDYAILMPDAAGGAGNCKISGCTINGASRTGGIKFLRATANTQVLKTDMNAVLFSGVEFDTSRSTVAPGNSDGILIQDVNIIGASAANNPNQPLDTATLHGMIRFLESLASNITIQRVDLQPKATTGIDGVAITGATVANVLIDHMSWTFPHPTDNTQWALAYLRSGGGSDPALNTFTVSNCTWHGAGLTQWNNAQATNLTYNTITADGIRFQETNGSCAATNMVLQAVNFTQTRIVPGTWLNRACGLGFGVLGTADPFTLNGLLVENSNLICPLGDGGILINTVPQNNQCVSLFGTNSSFQNMTFRNTRLEAYYQCVCARVVPVNNITFDGCVMNSGQHAIASTGAGTSIANLVVNNCDIYNGSRGTLAGGLNCNGGIYDRSWGSGISGRVSGYIRDATFTNTRFRGFRGIDFLDQGVNRNIVVRNCQFNTIRNCFYAGVNAVVNNVLIEDCVLNAVNPTTRPDWQPLADWQTSDAQGRTNGQAINIAQDAGTSPSPSVVTGFTMRRCTVFGTRQGVDVDDGCQWHNVNFDTVSFSGAEGNGFQIESGALVENATFTNCQFACTAGANDTANKRTAGFLLEGPGTTFATAGFHGCTFSGNNAALAMQRLTISAGPSSAAEPLANNLLFENSTISGATDRGLSLQYIHGTNVLFQGLTIQNVRDMGAYVQFSGNRVVLDNVTFNGGGTAAGMWLGTSLEFNANGWQVSNSNLTNLAGVGILVRNSLKTSRITGTTLTGAPGSSHGIFVDNSVATSQFTAGLNILDCPVGGFGGDGVRLMGSSHIVRGCTITGVGGNGVRLVDDSSLQPAPASVQCVTNWINNCLGAGLYVEGKDGTIGWNRLVGNYQGLVLRTGLSGLLASQSNTKNNTIKRNCVYGGVGSGTGISEVLNPAFAGDTGPTANVYVNNTVTDWAQGSQFLGVGNRVQNNIFAYNAGTGLRFLPAGLSGLVAGWNCAGDNGVRNFDGIFVDYTKDIWYTPGFSSRSPAAVDFYYLVPVSPCRDRGTGNGSTADGMTDLGCIESGPSEVASWRML